MFIVFGPPAFVITALVCYIVCRIVIAEGSPGKEPDPHAPGHVLYRPESIGWHPDPLAHFPQRWWDGEQWTERVRNGLDESTDEPPSRWRLLKESQS